jgi:endonuclease YncB( thermonuclease family)
LPLGSVIRITGGGIMGKVSAVCEYVKDGDTFRTAEQHWIRLARYSAPEEDSSNYDKAKQLLSNLILNKEIVYEQVGTSYARIVAEVWQDNKNINDIMIRSGY